MKENKDHTDRVSSKNAILNSQVFVKDKIPTPLHGLERRENQDRWADHPEQMKLQEANEPALIKKQNRKGKHNYNNCVIS
jgi:hypothetical protein